ncbi:MAG: CBS domain-containing protein [Deltaproteobacteria bacterium]|nr:CBS domain-containing protein [Deltaproteobacteria bacterium]
MKIREFMTTRVEFVDADGSVYDAVEKMVDRRIRSVAVRLKQKNNSYGVITARDVVYKVLSKGMDPRNTKASDIASKPIVCVEKDIAVLAAAEVMEKSKIARVFVREGEKIVGVVSLLDIMSAALIMRARGDHVS